MNFRTIGLIGYGEVGKIFAAGLRSKDGVTASGAWDLKFAGEDPTEREHAGQADVTPYTSLSALCEASDLIIAAVTASQTLAMAEQVAKHIQPGSVYLDLNSASPCSKQRCAVLIEASGAHYVEAGLMTSVPPYGIKTPMLLGGKRAGELAIVLAGWGMDATAISEKLGAVSAIKMCRSVMIKGLEALVIESYTTARAYGVENHVLPTLAETFPGIDWEKTGAYYFSGVAQHGRRRAEEMRESAYTVCDAGFEPIMAASIAGRQQWMADQAKAGVFEGLSKDAPWQEYADRLLAARTPP